MCQNPSDANSETYEPKIVTFEHGQPEELLGLMKNFRREVYGTGTMTASGKINHISTLLRGEANREFEKPASQNAGTNNVHLKFTQEGLIGYYLSINALSNQKRAIRHAMCKH